MPEHPDRASRRAARREHPAFGVPPEGIRHGSTPRPRPRPDRRSHEPVRGLVAKREDARHRLSDRTGLGETAPHPSAPMTPSAPIILRWMKTSLPGVATSMGIDILASASQIAAVALLAGRLLPGPLATIVPGSGPNLVPLAATLLALSFGFEGLSARIRLNAQRTLSSAISLDLLFAVTGSPTGHALLLRRETRRVLLRITDTAPTIARLLTKVVAVLISFIRGLVLLLVVGSQLSLSGGALLVAILVVGAVVVSRRYRSSLEAVAESQARLSGVSQEIERDVIAAASPFVQPRLAEAGTVGFDWIPWVSDVGSESAAGRIERLLNERTTLSMARQQVAARNRIFIAGTGLTGVGLGLASFAASGLVIDANSGALLLGLLLGVRSLVSASVSGLGLAHRFPVLQVAVSLSALLGSVDPTAHPDALRAEVLALRKRSLSAPAGDEETS